MITADITMADGNITTTKAGKVWTLRVHIPNALNIRLLFDSFDLSATAEMYVFDERRTSLYSCIKKSNFTYSSSIGLSAISTNTIIIYIIEPGNFDGFQSRIGMKKIEAGYLPINGMGRDMTNPEVHRDNKSLTASVNCIPSVRCQPDKMPYARAIARVAVNGSGGTGTLINNEANNGRPYFLTAFHVVDANDNGVLDPGEIAGLTTANFDFQFWSTNCGGGMIEPGIPFSGAVLRAQSASTDVVLLEMLNPPGIGDLVNYAGWNRQTGSPTGYSPFVIHHPQGEDMRITGVSSVSNWLWNSDYWVAYYYSGVVDRGSSGSALMNPNGQVIGQLKGGWSSCDYTDFGDHYGKFDKSWNYANLQAWLSPSQNKQSTQLLNLTDIPIYGPTTISCTGPAQYTTLSNLLDVTYTWSVSSGLQILSGQGTSSVTISGLSGGNYGAGTLTLTLHSPNKGLIRTYTVSKNINISTGGASSIGGTYNSSNSSAELLVPTPPKVLDWPGNAACIALVTNMVVPSGSTVSWSGTADPGVTWYQTSNNVFVSFGALNQIADLTITITNSCGSYSQRYRFRCTSTNTCGIQPL